MSFGHYVLILIGILLFLKYLWNRRKYYYLSWKMESLLGLPFLGVALNVRNPANLLQHISEVRRNFQSRNGLIWFGPQPIIYISEPELMKKIMTSPNFLNKMYLYKNFAKHFGNGIISSSSPIWNHHRKLLEPSFTYNTVKSYLSIFNEETEIICDRLKMHIGNGEFNIMPFTQLLTVDVACRTTVGKRMHFQTNQNSEIVECLVNLLKLTVIKSSNPIYYFDFIYNLTKYGRMGKKYKKCINEFVRKIFNENYIKRNEFKDNDDDEEEEEENQRKAKLFLERGVEFVRNKELSVEDVIDETVTIISGADTTSNTLSYTIMCLAMFPQYQEKLFNELKIIFPNKNAIDVTAENLKEMIYLEMIINENMRIMSPIPLVGRTAKDDFQLDNNIILPKGAQIFLDIFNMHRDERNWGLNANIFNPNNFCLENRQTEHDSKFIPFANGNRPCIGSKYAMMLAKITLIKIIRRYKFKTKFCFNNLQFVENVTLKLDKVPLVEMEERLE